MRPYYLSRMTWRIIKAYDRGLREKKNLLQKVVDFFVEKYTLCNDGGKT